MFSKKIAGIGAVAALVGSTLLPSVAFADDSASMVPADTGVAITSTVVDDDQIGNDANAYAAAATDSSVLTSSASETVTNTYENVTTTELLREYMPYVLMVAVPLFAIICYVALRRKLEL